MAWKREIVPKWIHLTWVNIIKSDNTNLVVNFYSCWSEWKRRQQQRTAIIRSPTANMWSVESNQGKKNKMLLIPKLWVYYYRCVFAWCKAFWITVGFSSVKIVAFFSLFSSYLFICFRWVPVKWYELWSVHFNDSFFLKRFFFLKWWFSWQSSDVFESLIYRFCSPSLSLQLVEGIHYSNKFVDWI